MESISSGVASAPFWFNEDSNSGVSSTSEESAVSDSDHKTQSPEATKKEEVPSHLIVDTAEAKTPNENMLDLTNATTPTPTSPHSNFIFGDIHDVTGDNWNIHKFVSGSKNILGQHTSKYEPKLNLCQEEVLLYNVDRDDFFFSSSLLHLQS